MEFFRPDGLLRREEGSRFECRVAFGYCSGQDFDLTIQYDEFLNGTVLQLWVGFDVLCLTPCYFSDIRVYQAKQRWTGHALVFGGGIVTRCPSGPVVWVFFCVVLVQGSRRVVWPLSVGVELPRLPDVVRCDFRRSAPPFVFPERRQLFFGTAVQHVDGVYYRSLVADWRSAAFLGRCFDGPVRAFVLLFASVRPFVSDETSVHHVRRLFSPTHQFNSNTGLACVCVCAIPFVSMCVRPFSVQHVRLGCFAHGTGCCCARAW